MQIVGVLWTGEPGVTETVGQIMERQRLQPPRSGALVQGEPRLLGVREHLPQNPDSVASSHWPILSQRTAGPLVSESVLAVPQTVGTSFLAAQISDSSARSGAAPGSRSSTRA